MIGLFKFDFDPFKGKTFYLNISTWNISKTVRYRKTLLLPKDKVLISLLIGIFTFDHN